jgi:hypothetical protein
MGGRAAVAGRAWALALGLTALVGCGDDGHPPQIADPGPQVAVVGQGLVVLVQASDPDGDALDYSFTSPTPSLEDAAALVVSPDGRAIFSWTPLAEDLGRHAVELQVTDGTFETALPFTVEVRGAGEGSEPTFTEPLAEGLVHDLADGPCVPTVAIAVSDPDDTEIELRQEEPLLAGAELTGAPGGLQGLWDWCPTEAQQAAAGVHELVLAADDGANPPTLLHFSIFLKRDGESCPCACEDDENEDDDELAQALDGVPLPEGALMGRLCPSDEDWHLLELTARARVRAVLSSASMPAPDMALQLTTDTGFPVVLAATPGTAMEAIDSECLDPGRYALRVFAAQTDFASDYQLSYVLDANGC